jgi:hypothetical protein
MPFNEFKLYRTLRDKVRKFFKKDSDGRESFSDKPSRMNEVSQDVWIDLRPSINHHIETAYELREKIQRSRPNTATETLP